MRLYKTTDTIAAIATALGESGIGIVRISGEHAINIADKIYRPSGDGSILATAPTHTIHYGHIFERDECIDEVLVMLMRAPHTYTGEDTIEIDCHGGVLVVQKVLEAVLHAGARLAEPGEFSKRAFMNGKMDLSKAEAIIDIIEAKSSYALMAGESQLSGRLKDSIDDLRNHIREEIAYIEAALDDPEHYDLSGYPKKLKKRVSTFIDKMTTLITGSRMGIIMKEGVDTVILGRPNAGKSSLMNYLLGRQRAIVTDIAGTTRDTITEHISLDGISLNITDTAGIRQTGDMIEQIGVDKAREAASQADLVLCMIDGSQELTDEDIEILTSIEDKKSIILINKTDIKLMTSEEEVKKHTHHRVIGVSAKDGSGIDELTDTIRSMFYHGEIDFNDQIYITSIRHREALLEAKESLEMVLSSIEEDQPEDFFSIDLLNAYEQLGEITGETLDDDIIDEIFSKFCMGK